MRIGLLALQGAFSEHIVVLRRLGVEVREIRMPEALEEIDGLIIPGGESTTIGKLAQSYGLIEPIRQLALAGRPIWGTCAGMILLARKVVDGQPGQPQLGLIDITVVRNGFGRQVDSFEADLEVPLWGAPPFRGVFIRAPYVREWGAGVEVLACLEGGAVVATQQGRCVVAAQQGRCLVTAFHPELTDDVRFHQYFLQLAESEPPPVAARLRLEVGEIG